MMEPPKLLNAVLDVLNSVSALAMEKFTCAVLGCSCESVNVALIITGALTGGQYQLLVLADPAEPAHF